MQQVITILAATALLAGSAFAEASTDPRFSGITAEADAWVLAFRHKTAAHTGGSMWPRNRWSMNADNEQAPLYSIMDSITDFMHNDTYIFMLRYPTTCKLNPGTCIDDKDYNIWSQTSNPFIDSKTNLNQATDYTPIDVVYPGAGSRLFKGLGASASPQNTLMDAMPYSTNWHFAVGASATWKGSNRFPGFVHPGVEVSCDHAEVFVWNAGDGTCPTGEYNTFKNNVNKCRPHTACVVGTNFETTAATDTSDRVCTDVSVCEAGSQWEISAPTRFDDRECAGISICDDTQYELTAPTTTTDRQCAIKTACASPFAYEVAAPSATTDRVCRPTTVCTDDQFEQTPPTTTTDRVCGECEHGTQVLRKDGSGCQAARECSDKEFAAAEAFGASDTMCSDRSTCSPLEFEVVKATATSDTVCATATVCEPAVQEVGQPATAGADAVCAERCAPCEGNEAVLTPCSATTERQCVAVAAPVPVLAKVAAIAADGADIEIAAAQGGEVTVRGALNADSVAVGGVDLVQWVLALQRETQAFRSAALAKDTVQQARIQALTAQVGILSNRLAQLEQQVERAH